MDEQHQEIQHKKVRYVHPEMDAATAVEVENEMGAVEWATELHCNAGLIICAAVLEREGSLKLAASVLEVDVVKQQAKEKSRR